MEGSRNTMALDEFLAWWEEVKYTKNFPTKKVVAVLGAVAIGTVGVWGVPKVVDFVAHISLFWGIDDYLPEGFKNLEIGMSFQDVQKVRPYTKTTAEDAGVEKLSDSSMEKFSQHFGRTDLFSGLRQVEYFFTDNKLHKIQFNFYGRECGGNIQETSFRKAAEQLYGESKNFEWRKGEVLVKLYDGGNTFECFRYVVSNTNKGKK